MLSVIATNKAFQFILSTVTVLLCDRCENKSQLPLMSSHTLDWRWNPLTSQILSDPIWCSIVRTSGMVPSSHSHSNHGGFFTPHIEKLHQASFKAVSTCLRFCCSSRMALTSSWCTTIAGQEWQEVFQHTSPPQSSELDDLMVQFFLQNHECLMPTHVTLLQLANHFVISSALACKDSLASLFCISWRKLVICFVIARASNSHAVFPEQHCTAFVYLVLRAQSTYITSIYTIGQL